MQQGPLAAREEFRVALLRDALEEGRHIGEVTEDAGGGTRARCSRQEDPDVQ